MPYKPAASSLPLTPVMFELLLALADGDLHGYGILQAIEPRLRRTLPVRTGTLYRALAAALESGLIEEIPSPDEPRRRVYRLTAHGRSVLQADADRLADQVDAARAKQVLPTRPR